MGVLRSTQIREAEVEEMRAAVLLHGACRGCHGTRREQVMTAARTSTFSGRLPSGAPFPVPVPGAASLGRSSLMAATTLSPRRRRCCGARWWNGATQSSFAPRRPGTSGLAAAGPRRRPVSSLHGAAMLLRLRVWDLRFVLAALRRDRGS